jgi:hypothetical protein
MPGPAFALKPIDLSLDDLKEPTDAFAAFLARFSGTSVVDPLIIGAVAREARRRARRDGKSSKQATPATPQIPDRLG